jgi:hypothetical protein
LPQNPGARFRAAQFGQILNNNQILVLDGKGAMIPRIAVGLLSTIQSAVCGVDGLLNNIVQLIVSDTSMKVCSGFFGV